MNMKTVLRMFYANSNAVQGPIQSGVLYVGYHGWPAKKILGFRWSKEAEITLENIVFGKIFLSVFSNFLHFY